MVIPGNIKTISKIKVFKKKVSESKLQGLIKIIPKSLV